MSVIEDNWDYFIDLNNYENKGYYKFESKVTDYENNVLNLLYNGFKPQKFLYNRSGTGTQNNDDELKYFIEKNKELRHEIEKTSEEIALQQLQYEKYKKGQRVLSQEIKDKHEAFLMAKKYYKKFLKMYYSIESRDGDMQTIYVQFFSEAKKDSENHSVRLQRNAKSGKYQLLSTNPKLLSIKDLQRRLQETNDIPAALCSIREAFIDMKKSKK